MSDCCFECKHLKERFPAQMYFEMLICELAKDVIEVFTDPESKKSCSIYPIKHVDTGEKMGFEDCPFYEKKSS